MLRQQNTLPQHDISGLSSKLVKAMAASRSEKGNFEDFSMIMANRTRGESIKGG